MKDHSWQLSSLELSKRLKELGVKQESLYYWVHLKSVTDYENIVLWKRDRAFGNMPKGFGKKIGVYSAFTCAELMKIHYELRLGNYPDFRGLGISPNGLANFIAKEIINANKT